MPELVYRRKPKDFVEVRLAKSEVKRKKLNKRHVLN
jgi:hypothetical protein